MCNTRSYTVQKDKDVNLGEIPIEQLLYETLNLGVQTKVAMLIAKAAGNGLVWKDENATNKALLQLSKRPDVETFGDIRKWRFSEMKRIEV